MIDARSPCDWSMYIYISKIKCAKKLIAIFYAVTEANTEICNEKIQKVFIKISHFISFKIVFCSQAFYAKVRVIM